MIDQKEIYKRADELQENGYLCANRSETFRMNEVTDLEINHEEKAFTFVGYPEPELTMGELVRNVINWAEEKEILKPENSQAQMCKVIEEVGETSRALLKKDKEGFIDGIGDSFVTLIILAAQNGYSPQMCLSAAWNEIKDRKGKTEDGVFKKA
jgi:phosphoribosyl-ATP pyrophosphohydrolase